MFLAHMKFADDIVIFGKVILANIQHMLKVVEDFCLASRQTMNYTKSQIVYQDKGFLLLSNSFKYLGYPYFKDGRHTQILNKVVLDTEARITNWQLRPLSQMKREIVIKICINGTPNLFNVLLQNPQGNMF